MDGLVNWEGSQTLTEKDFQKINRLPVEKNH